MTVVDAEYGARRLAQHSACWQQAAAADHLVISKCDLAGRDEIANLEQQLRSINPLASMRQFPADGTPDFLFERTAERPARFRFSCLPGASHLAQIDAVVLKPEGPLSWRKFQIWLNDLLESLGPNLLRLKGCLLFDHAPKRMIIQAVHQTFYPVVEAPERMEDGSEFLVLIIEGRSPTDVAQGFANCRADR